jgi:hypothetical protein
MFLAGCGEDEVTKPDTTPPLSVTDLRVIVIDTMSVTLAWTASGDDWAEGSASSYDIRYSESTISELNWHLASTVASTLKPKPSGTEEQQVILGLTPYTQYYFAMRVADDAGNLSGLSNVASAHTKRPAVLIPESPEQVVEELVQAYVSRDIDRYMPLLAPEFVFWFQPSDAQDLGGDFWTRDQDSVGTDALFRTPLVSDIRVELTYGNAEEFAPGVMAIQVTHTLLEVDQVDGITWRVDGDLQHMFFRRGREMAGEDPDRWFLVDWRDTPAGAGAPSPAVETVTWGRLKALYVESRE